MNAPDAPHRAESADAERETGAPVARAEAVNIVFGKTPARALPLMDAGKSREEIRAETGQILGVHDASFTLHEREILVLMGLSGSGKSTLLRAINGLNRVVRGRVEVHDGERLVEVTNADSGLLRRVRTERVAMVFQQFALLPWRTVTENVALGLELARVPSAERKRRVAAQLELVGLAGQGDRPVGSLSGGMQQRVGLARAFATEAPILLMDEPFSALDPLIRSKLQDELLLFQETLKRSLLFVCHDLDEAVKLGNRIAIMEGGRIVQMGKPQDIVLRPANDYVAEFVSHMNPLNVLCACDIMRVADESRPPARPAGGAEGNADPVSVPPLMPVRDIMRLAAKTPRIEVVEDDRVVGTLGPKEIFDALLREPRASKGPAGKESAARRETRENPRPAREEGRE